MKRYFVMVIPLIIMNFLSITGESVGGEMKMQHNWCTEAQMKCETDSSARSTCRRKLLLLLLSEESQTFSFLTQELAKDPRTVLLTSRHSPIMEACANVSSSIVTFNGYTGDPFTHNPINIKEIIHHVQQICLKNLETNKEPEGLAMLSEAHIIAIPYRFPSFRHVQQLLTLFPCSRAVVSRRHEKTSRLRALKRAVPMFAVAARGPASEEEAAAALRWLQGTNSQEQGQQ